MFELFTNWLSFTKWQKSEKQKLTELYNKKKEQAFRLSRTNRKEGDRLEKEANDILNKIDKIK